MSDDIKDNIIIGTIVGALIVFIAIALHFIIEDAKHWEVYKKTHHCVYAGEISGDVNTGAGFGSDGKITVITTTTPSKTIYKCDGGLTFVR